PDHGRHLPVVDPASRWRYPVMTRTRFAGAHRAAAGLAVGALLVAACTRRASPSPTASALANVPPAASEQPATPSPTEAASAPEASESALPSAVATDIDPCQLITSADASSWVGVKFGAGKESTNDNNVKICNYDAAGPNLFFVEVAIAPDVAPAKAAEAAQEAYLQDQAGQLASLGLTVEKLPNFAPNTDAAILQGGMSAGGQKVAARAMFVLRGTTFVGFSDTAVNSGGQPPSEQAFKDKANELLPTQPEATSA